jgi:hypothetical protein
MKETGLPAIRYAYARGVKEGTIFSEVFCNIIYG